MARSPADDDRARPLQVTRWSTRNIAPARRFRVWLQRPMPSVARLFSVRAVGVFETAVEEVMLGATFLQWGEGTERVYERTAWRAEDDGVDLFGIGFILTGRLDGETGHGPLHAGAGEVVFLDLAQASRFTLSASSSVQWVMPRALARRHFGTVADLHGMVIDAPTVAIASGYLAELRRSLASWTVEQGERIAANLLDLLAIVVQRGATPAAAAAAPDRPSAARPAAELAVERQLGDVTLNAATLCAQLGISRAALFRLFKVDGGVGAYLRGRRLEAVRRTLEDEGDRSSVALLAERWGFRSAALLTRQFRVRFGVTPTMYRGGGRRGDGGDGSSGE